MYICIYELAREREEAKSIRRPRRVAYVFSSFSLSLSWSREETRALSAKVSPMMNSRTGTKRNSDQSTRERERESGSAGGRDAEAFPLSKTRESIYEIDRREKERKRDASAKCTLSLSLHCNSPLSPFLLPARFSLSLSLSLCILAS